MTLREPEEDVMIDGGGGFALLSFKEEVEDDVLPEEPALF